MKENFQTLVSPEKTKTYQQISKIVRGTENLTLESLVKIERVLGIQLLVVNHP
jgi:hypothetical protein